jgi:hypothetical protein
MRTDSTFRPTARNSLAMARSGTVALLAAAIAGLAAPGVAQAVSFVEDPHGGPITISGFGFSADPAFAPPSASEAHAINTQISNFSAFIDKNTDISGAAPETIGGVPYVLRTFFWTEPNNSAVISDWLTIEASVVSSASQFSTMLIGFHSLQPGDPQPVLPNVNGSLFNQGSEAGPFTSFTNFFEDSDDGSFVNADSAFINVSITSVDDAVAVPEPSSLALLALGVGGVAARRWRTTLRTR